MLLPKFIQIPTDPIFLIQGTKTRLIPFLLSNIQWEGEGIYYEFFVGSASVLLNVLPKKAIVNDINPHLIQFYLDLKENRITMKQLKEYLNKQRNLLIRHGKEYYYEQRDLFNQSPNSELFLFLNLVAWRHLMRFNSEGQYNAPFCHDFTRNIINKNSINTTYITTVLNRLRYMQNLFLERDYQFFNLHFKDFSQRFQFTDKDFIYLDPPYILRDTQYYDKFEPLDFEALINFCNSTQSGYGFSYWYKDRNGINPYLEKIHLQNVIMKVFNYHYRIGDKKGYLYENNDIQEAFFITKQNEVKKQFNLERFNVIKKI